MDINKANPVELYKNFQGYGGFKELYNSGKRILRDTSIEIFLAGAIGLFAGGILMYGKEKAREASIPLGFSEISQIERDAKRYGQTVTGMNEYLPKVNDLTMKVFESWNLSNERIILGKNTQAFAKELDMNMDKSLKVHHYNLGMLLNDAPRLSKNALTSWKDFIDVSLKMNKVNNEFNESWDDIHTDNYHTEVYTETVSDGDGKSHTETRTRQVYDDTTHRYRYDRQHGELASQKIDEVIKIHPELKFNEGLRTASKTNAEGEYAADKSRKNIKKNKARLDRIELTNIANTWMAGSTLMTNLGEISLGYGSVRKDADLWRTAKTTSKNETHTNTYQGRNDPQMPREFRVAETTLEDGKNLCRLIDEVTLGMEFTKNQTPILKNKINEFIAVSLENKKGNAEKLKKEIMDMAIDIYQANFKKGFDVKRFRAGMVILGSFLGGLVGAGAGAGLDKLGDKFNWYGKGRREERYLPYSRDPYYFNRF
ncbi:MAG: hypothetical protein Q7S33_01215 [Nanoarchaeota archaeon]|nr:hypothetical protein [Nanoarchaeota archaeon]